MKNKKKVAIKIPSISVGKKMPPAVSIPKKGSSDPGKMLKQKAQKTKRG